MKRILKFLLLLTATLAAVVVVLILWLTVMPGRSFAGDFAPLDRTEQAVLHRLDGHIQELAVSIGPRNGVHPGSLERSESYLIESLKAFAVGVERHEFEVDGTTFVNVVGELPGEAASAGSEQILVLGAHYDTFGVSPGADDNATGVAALLELARLLQPGQREQTLRFCFFANEEPPYFGTDGMGSVHYARRCAERGEDVVAMLSFDSLGYFVEDEGSQGYPADFFRYLYPTRGDFVAFVGDIASRGLVRDSIGAFREHTNFASEGLIAPRSVTGVDWSDHASFWDAGYPAIMVTDTAVFRNPSYHDQMDVPARIDLASLARITLGLSKAIEALAR